MPGDDVIDPLELSAYADGELGPERRIAVEHWLSQNPQAAAQVMGDLHLRDQLLLAHDGEGMDGPAATEALALRLGGKLAHRPTILRAAPLLAACLLVAMGWFANDLLGLTNLGSIPHYVTAAVEAHHTTELRTEMHFQTQPLGPDATEMLARTQIELPVLPADWTVTDIQLFPSEFGPSVEVAVDTGKLGLVSIFAARPGKDQIVPPVTLQVDDTTTAYWQSGRTAYALVASASSTDMSNAAMSLFQSLR